MAGPTGPFATALWKNYASWTAAERMGGGET